MPRRTAAPAAAGRAADEPIAIIAHGRPLPRRADVEQFWDNLCAGRDSDHASSTTPTLDAGVGAALRGDPAYVRARGVIDGVEMFDAALLRHQPAAKPS